jgi:5-formyltetrahydrofolate cyclo-ligase
MQFSKSSLRKKAISERKKKYLKIKNFDFKKIFKLINKFFLKKNITIAGYYPSNHEVDIIKFLEEAYKKNFKIALPVINSSSKMCFKSWIFKDPLHVSKFGTLEPKKSNKDVLPDLILVPLVAFDNQLNRIGYGKGYYDRSLKKINKIKKKTISVGIAYSFQEFIKIPVNKHDVKLDYILTERGIISSHQ